MKKKLFILSSVFVALAIASIAMANDSKTYMGSTCSYADHPLDSHNKIHHRFKNTSSSNQWVTCPVVRDQITKDIASAWLEVSGNSSYQRFEERDDYFGSLYGWNIDSSEGCYQGPGDSTHCFVWNAHDTHSEGAYAIEAQLSPGAYISMYKVKEKD